MPLSMKKKTIGTKNFGTPILFSSAKEYKHNPNYYRFLIKKNKNILLLH